VDDDSSWIWGVNPYPLSDPIGTLSGDLWLNLSALPGPHCPGCNLSLFILELFFKKTIVGKIVVAALGDKEGVRCLGINVDKYFAVVFISPHLIKIAQILSIVKV
jgi:hypothetical protein